MEVSLNCSSLLVASYKMKFKKINMKKTIFFASFLGTVMLTACINNEDVAEANNKIEISGNHFIFTTEDFGAEMPTRAAVPLERVNTVDLGDGLQAEVTIGVDCSPQVRAVNPIADGHYTIYAVNNSGERVTGIDSKVSGTVTAGRFIKDPGTNLRLSPGTYTFVCYNDAVIDNGTNLIVNNGSDALVGTATENIHGEGWKVNFTMKHQGARVRYKLTSYTSASSGVAVQFTSTTSDQPIRLTLNTKGVVETVNSGVLSGISTSFAATSEAVNSSYTLPYTTPLTDYNFLLPGVKGNKLKLTFTRGRVYGENLAGKSLTLAFADELARNGSYVVHVKLKKILYLYDDGTVGTFAERGTRRPIGVVVQDKLVGQNGVAMALTSNPIEAQWSTRYGVQDNAIMGNDFVTVMNDMNGYKYTWDPSTSKDGVTVKAESSTFPAFYAAGHYHPNVTVTGKNVGKWFLPSMGQWRLAIETLYQMKVLSQLTDWGYPQVDQDKSNRIKTIFEQAGGHNPMNNNYWSSNEYGLENVGDMCFRPREVELDDYGYGKTTINWGVLPFVHF